MFDRTFSVFSLHQVQYEEQVSEAILEDKINVSTEDFHRIPRYKSTASFTNVSNEERTLRPSGIG